MLHRKPFLSFTYALRLAIVVVYFHRKFQKGSAKRAWRRFEDAHQYPDESIQAWAIRIERYEIDVKRYGTTIPFDDYLQKWSTGTNPGFFVNELRKAKNSVIPGMHPIIRDRNTFQDWKTSMLGNALQTKREQDTYRELVERSKRNSYPSTPVKKKFTPKSHNTSTHGTDRSPQKDRDGPGYRKTRNPHSLLLTDKPEKDRERIRCPTETTTDRRFNVSTV